MSKDEINRLLAEKVMGWRWVAMPDLGNTWRHYQNDLGEPALIGEEWNPHDNIVQAMMVVDKIIAMGYHFVAYFTKDEGWGATFEDGDSVFHCSGGNSAEIAICYAALRVVEDD